VITAMNQHSSGIKRAQFESRLEVFDVRSLSVKGYNIMSHVGGSVRCTRLVSLLLMYFD
jgi:hypothetical protein